LAVAFSSNTDYPKPEFSVFGPGSIIMAGLKKSIPDLFLTEYFKDFVVHSQPPPYFGKDGVSTNVIPGATSDFLHHLH
jgi:hypothetical protein